MDRFDAAQARDHIEMVDRILAEAHPRLCAGGEYFVIWGIASAYITIAAHLVRLGLLPAAALWSLPVVLAACATSRCFAAARRSAFSRARRSFSANFSTCFGSRSGSRSW